MNTVKFPATLKWDHDAKSDASWLRRLWWKLIGRRKANRAKLILDRARRG